MKQFERGLDLWQNFAETLMSIRDSQGDIHRDDARIWDGYLHQWNNEEWIAVTECVAELYTRYPEMFESYHTKTLKETAHTLIKHQAGHGRVLDTKMYKTLAWKMSMSLEEIWRNCMVTATNNNKSVISPMERLFDIE